jgi:acyl-CoA thioesterase I
VQTPRSSLFILAAGLICIVFLASCGSRKNTPSTEERTPAPSGSDTSVPAPQTAVSDHRPVIITFGDSLTAGVAGRSYPDQLQDLLDANKLAYRVDNQGVSGDTTTDGLARIDNVITQEPALVVLEFGGNDGLRGIPVESTRRNLIEMIERLKAAHIHLVLLGITLPPNYGPDYVKPFTAMFPELARQYHLPFIPFLLANVYRNRELMQPDDIHPNGAGNKILAQDVFELIRPLLKRTQAAGRVTGRKMKLAESLKTS